jgi:ligand-binding SRPBCC domain-containing protein
MYRLTANQFLPIGKQVAWEFLSNPANLQRITPTKMGFEILSGADRAMYPGQIIQYNVSPLPGIRTRWVSEITHVSHGSYFVDEQRFGPYSLWHHKHFIHEVAGGVRMEDIVDYKLPLGLLGSVAQPLLVRKQLTEIFDFREKALRDLFGSIPGHATTLSIEMI